MRKVVAKRLAKVSWNNVKLDRRNLVISTPRKLPSGALRYPTGCYRRVYLDTKREYRAVAVGAENRRSKRVVSSRPRGFYALPGMWGRI